MIRIGNLIFDNRTGEIELPGWQSQPFSLPGTLHAGVQINPPVGKPSELTLTRHGHAADSGLIYATQLLLKATEQYITLGRIDYGFDFGYKFHIIDVMPVMTEEIPHASGHRDGGDYEYSPACIVVTKWHVLPLPI